MKLIHMISILMLIFICCSCGTPTETSEEKVFGKDTGIPELNVAINNYFNHINDINKWSPYATEEFVKRVYSWCSGDTSESKTLEEMKAIYYDINKDSLKLTGYIIDEVENKQPINVIISVTREWEDGQKDQTSYSLVRINNEWKVDNRF